MALIKCPQCGQNVSDKALRCPKCGYSISQSISSQESVAQVNQTPVDSTVPSDTPTSSTGSNPPKKKSNTWVILVVIAALLLLGGGVGGWFYYKNIYLPKKIDAEAPRYYTFAHILNLRSSMSSGADYNKVAELPYGTELITYDYGTEWSRVKVSKPGYNGEQQEGYASSAFILNKADFFLLNSIFGDTDSKDVIGSAKCRIALLNYFKDKGYIGKISDAERQDAGIYTMPNATNQWQVFSKAKTAKSNSVYYKRIVNPDSKFTDFAVIILNVSSPSVIEKKLLLFTFDDDETPHLYYEERVPTSGYYIKQISLDYWDGVKVVYTDE